MEVAMEEVMMEGVAETVAVAETFSRQSTRIKSSLPYRPGTEIVFRMVDRL
jgi:hypothetical protein